MQASDIMTTKVVTVEPETDIRDIAQLFLKHRISAVPVVDSNQEVLGIVSEGDLMRRPENKTEGRHSWWLAAVLSPQEKAMNYIKTHGQIAQDVMTRHVVSIKEDAPLYEIADLLEKHHIKRAPVVRDGRLVGIVSRANLLHGLAAKGAESPEAGPKDDQIIREKLLDILSKEVGLDTALFSVIVNDGVVQLWGIAGNAVEKKAAQIAIENTRGVKSIINNMGQEPPWIFGT